MIYKNKIFRQVKQRMCVVWHYPFGIEPLSHFGQQSVQAILSAISQKLEFTSEPTIHQATEERVVISFSQHQDAIQAFRLWNHTSTLYINGVPYRFNMDTSKEYLPRVVADHRIIVALRSLPLHLRSHDAVEMILSPYCVVDYIMAEADALDVLSMFTCLPRRQHTTCVLSDITVKINKEDFQPVANEVPHIDVLLDGYTVSLAFTEHINEFSEIARQQQQLKFQQNASSTDTLQ